MYRALILDLYITHFSVGFSWFRALLTLVSDFGMVRWSASHKDGYGNDIFKNHSDYLYKSQANHLIS